MTRRLLLVAALVALAACGSDDDSGGSGPPTISTPPPPVSTPLNGTYDLVVEPDGVCDLPSAPYVLTVNVTTFATGSGDELRGTLPGEGTRLTLDMLYPMTGRLQGSLSTQPGGVPLPAGGWLYLRDSGLGLVSLAASGRAEVVDAVMAGDVSYSADGATFITCSSQEHGWALVAR
jgi:hypothetical protein